MDSSVDTVQADRSSATSAAGRKSISTSTVNDFNCHRPAPPRGNAAHHNKECGPPDQWERGEAWFQTGSRKPGIFRELITAKPQLALPVDRRACK